MSTRPCKPRPLRANPENSAMRLALLLALAAAAPGALALSTDRQQTMTTKSDYTKVVQASANAAGSAYLRGNVQIVQGSMKAKGAEATIHQHPDGAKNAQGEDVSGSIQRIVLVGKQAHIEQQQDNGAGLMTADADKIDFDSDTGIAVLTGSVKVVQQGRGTFNGERMTYNTNTGEMESADTVSHTPITMTFEPKKKPATKPTATEQKPADAAPAKKDGATDGQP